MFLLAKGYNIEFLKYPPKIGHGAAAKPLENRDRRHYSQVRV